MVGKTLGHYEILEPLGAGGMGEVYRARDTTLGRDVAIKLIPEDFVTDTDRLARLEREARLLAALNHPNIATIHSFEQTDDTRFLVLEFVEGETLERRVARGPLPVAEALNLARQIARALEAAHAEGIVHRDLKPANVVIAADGHAKVLDFGIAKGDLPDAPTDTANATNLTVEGAVMGTPSYMSPEQVRGADIDKRADNWAFGCVLYEMLTGANAFATDTFADTMAAIVEREPDWDRLPAALPETLRSLMRRCLHKDREQRLHDIADARIEIDDAVKTSTNDGAAPVVERAEAEPTGRPSRVGSYVLVAIVAALALFSGYLGRGLWAPAPPPENWNTLQVTRSPYFESQPSLSPDGQFVAYASDESGNFDIWSQRVEGQRPRNLTADSPANDFQPAFSPDGSEIAFRSDRGGGGIYIMGATGENPRRVVDHGYAPEWAPDGESLVFGSSPVHRPAFLEPTPIYRIDLDTLEEIRLTDVGFAPTWSPNGHRIAFFGYEVGGTRDIFTIAPDGSGRVRLTDDEAFDWAPVWAPDGTRIYFSSDRGGVRNVWSIGIDEQSGRPTGQPQRVGASEAEHAWLSTAVGSSSIAYASLRRPFNLQRVAFDPEALAVIGEPEWITRGANNVYRITASPDGETVVYSVQGGNEHLFSVPSGGGEIRQITDHATRDRDPFFIGDGRIAFYADRTDEYQVWMLDPDSGETAQITWDEGSQAWQPVVSPDGGRLVYFAGADDVQVPVLMSLREPWDAQAPTRLFEAGAGRFRPNSWSPDGRMLAGWSIEPEPPHILIYSFDTGLTATVGDLAGHAHPVWLDNDNIIFTLNPGVGGLAPRRELMMANRHTGEHTTLLSDGVDWTFEESIALSPDKRWIYFVRAELESDIWLLRRDEPGGRRP